MHREKKSRGINPQPPTSRKTNTLTGLINIGAGITVISQKYWSLEWTLVPTLDAFVGIGGHSNAMWSLHPISFQGPEDHVATTKPFIIKREKILAWGRDILFQWGLRLEIKLTWISDKPVWVD